MSRANSIRILLAIALFVAVIFLPWWVALILTLALTLRFRAWEVAAAGVLFDILWLPGIPFESLTTLPFGTLTALILILVLEPLRRQLLLGSAHI